MDSPHYRLSIEHREQYILARLEAGWVNLGVAIDCINDFAAEVRRAGFRKVLFVREIPAVIPPDDDALIAAIIANLLPPDAACAIVDKRPEPIPAVKQEKVKPLRPNIVAFGCLDRAERWLLTDRKETRR